jgi:hypothetical protein
MNLSNQPVMAAKAAIHAFSEAKESGRFSEEKLRKRLLSRGHGSGHGHGHGQKGVDARFRGHDDVEAVRAYGRLKGGQAAAVQHAPWSKNFLRSAARARAFFIKKRPLTALPVA